MEKLRLKLAILLLSIVESIDIDDPTRSGGFSTRGRPPQTSRAMASWLHGFNPPLTDYSLTPLHYTALYCSSAVSSVLARSKLVSGFCQAISMLSAIQ
jgi:hypothetical protein